MKKKYFYSIVFILASAILVSGIVFLKPSHDDSEWATYENPSLPILNFKYPINADVKTDSTSNLSFIDIRNTNVYLNFFISPKIGLKITCYNHTKDPIVTSFKEYTLYEGKAVPGNFDQAEIPEISVCIDQQHYLVYIQGTDTSTDNAVFKEMLGSINFKE